MADSEDIDSTDAPEAPDEALPISVQIIRSTRRSLRTVLLALGPIAVALGGGYVYMNSGRYVETENAYVKATAVVVSAEVAGPIVEIAVTENQSVHAGDLLLRIEDAPYRGKVAGTSAQLEAVSSFVAGLLASYRQAVEQLKLAQSNVAYAKLELEREQSLAARNLGTESDLNKAQHEFDIAEQQIPIIEQTLAQLEAQLGPSFAGSIENHAAYRAVDLLLAGAKTDLEHTRIRAPIDGIVNHVPVSGAYVPIGGPVLSIVSDNELWIEANFKETQLTHIEVGQSVTASIDAYPDQEWHGTVASISQATGAEFSVVPAQNASGNWVKVAQRIPVRIALETGPNDPPLRAGMSVVVAVDTGYQRPAPKYLGFLAALRADG